MFLQICSKLSNLFSEKTILTENFIENSKNEIQFFHHKKETSLWDLNSSIDFCENNIIKIKSIDGMAAIQYNPQQQFFQVDYFYPMPKKKLIYCKNKELFFSKRVDFQNNRPAFEYIKIRKVFNVFECPIRWQVPLFLCVKYCLENNILMKCKKFF
jgi:hypothetical protein